MISRIFVQRIAWNDLVIEVSYEPDWMPGLLEAFGEPVAHLQVRSLLPERAPLLITETGYTSRFLGASEVNEQGGPAAYVRGWLDAASNDAAWKKSRASIR